MQSQTRDITLHHDSTVFFVGRVMSEFGYATDLANDARTATYLFQTDHVPVRNKIKQSERRL